MTRFSMLDEEEQEEKPKAKSKRIKEKSTQQQEFDTIRRAITQELTQPDVIAPPQEEELPPEQELENEPQEEQVQQEEQEEEPIEESFVKNPTQIKMKTKDGDTIYFTATKIVPKKVVKKPIPQIPSKETSVGKELQEDFIPLPESDSMKYSICPKCHSPLKKEKVKKERTVLRQFISCKNPRCKFKKEYVFSL